jgi:hypothetical protein
VLFSFSAFVSPASSVTLIARLNSGKIYWESLTLFVEIINVQVRNNKDPFLLESVLVPFADCRRE